AQEGRIAAEGVGEPVAPAPRARGEDADEDAVFDQEAPHADARDVLPNENVRAPVAMKRDRFGRDVDLARKVDRGDAPPEDRRARDAQSDGERAARVQEAEDAGRGDDHVLRPAPAAVRVGHPRSFAILSTSASIPTPVRKESVLTSGLPFGSSTSVVD